MTDDELYCRVMVERLTKAETETAQLTALGAPHKIVAHLQGISSRTAESHLQSIYSKLGIHGAVSLTHFAIAIGLVPLVPRLDPAKFDALTSRGIPEPKKISRPLTRSERIGLLLDLITQLKEEL